MVRFYLLGLATEKRPISMVKLANLVNQVEAKVTDSADREITTTDGHAARDR
jgi:hypothetical protein